MLRELPDKATKIDTVCTQCGESGLFISNNLTIQILQHVIYNNKTMKIRIINISQERYSKESLIAKVKMEWHEFMSCNRECVKSEVSILRSVSCIILKARNDSKKNI